MTIQSVREVQKCDCGEVMNTEHDDRKFEINGKQVCIHCWVKSVEMLNGK